MNAIARAQYRRDTYAEYRGRGETPECAALRVNVKPRTGRRYERAYREIRNQQQGTRT